MLSEIKTEFKPDGTQLPALYQHTKENGVVVLFDSINTGVVVSYGEGSLYPVGHYDRCWLSCKDCKIWRRMKPNEKVILSNED